MGAALFFPRDKRYVYALTGFVFLCSVFVFYASQPLLSDVSYFIAATQRILGGEVPYKDFLENNPPLAFWVTMPPLWLAKVFNLRAETVFVLYTMSIAVLIFYNVWQLTKDAILIFALVAVFSFGVAFGFGQREYFASLFFLPYICAVQSPKTKLAVLVGIFLGLAICFKPYFALIPACVELYLLLTTGRFEQLWRKEILIAFALAIFYPALVWFLYPQYYTDIVPLVLLTYGAYDASFLAIFSSSTFLLFIAIFISTLIIRFVTTAKNSSTFVWLVAAFGGLSAHLLQHKGWPYQLLPGITFASIAFLVTLAKVKNSFAKAASFGAFLLCCGVGLQDYARTQIQNATKFDQLLSDQTPKTMMMLSYDIGDSFPYMPARGLKWVGHFQSLWMMAAVAKKQVTADQAADVTHRMTELLRFDLEEQKPEFVIVEQQIFTRENAATGHAFFSNAAFGAAWSKYEWLNADSGYDLWRRKL
jgi:hypothetical protein